MTSPARAFPPPTPLRVVPPAGGVDLIGAERAAAAFLPTGPTLVLCRLARSFSGGAPGRRGA